MAGYALVAENAGGRANQLRSQEMGRNRPQQLPCKNLLHNGGLLLA